MASKSSINLTARDFEILAALIRTPLTARQLLQLSKTLNQPFTDERLVRRRLSQLVDADLVIGYQYSTTGASSMNYYKPTRSGYRLVQGHDATLPRRSYFRETSLSLQQHTRALSDFIVKMYVATHEQGIKLGGFYRENQLRLTIGNRSMQPDCAFQLLLPDGSSLNYLVEIDCGTEPIRSTKQRESLEGKIRFYDEYQDRIEKRFRVLMMFTKPSSRLTHFCDVANDIITDPQRTLFMAALLPGFLDHSDPLTAPVFLDRHQRMQLLLPKHQRPTQQRMSVLKTTNSLTVTSSVW